MLEYWNVGHNLCLASVALTMAHGAKVSVHGIEQPCRLTTLSYAYKSVVEQLQNIAMQYLLKANCESAHALTVPV